jgi:hypothetical protein
MPETGSVIVAAVAVVGQLVNVFLNLKLRAAIAESEMRVLDQVAREYKRQDVCAVEMKLLKAE